ncbi:protein FAM227B [Octopus bimaculoides]|nr:protein FAM227B [Octopus bimaculoides]
MTSLPYNIQPKEMLKKALHAHYSKIGSLQRPTFEKILYSKRCQDILQDIFWYLFLTNFQPDLSVQQKLFHRVAVNYVNLIHLARREKYFADTLFKELPKLMSLAVYGTFHHSFPDSHCQFDNVFKQSVIELIWLWMTGKNNMHSVALRVDSLDISGHTVFEICCRIQDINNDYCHHFNACFSILAWGNSLCSLLLVLVI